MTAGITVIHDDVFREIVRLLLEEVPEIYVYEPKNPLAPFLGDKSIRPQITVKRPEAPEEDREENREQVAYEIRLALLFGANIPRTVEKIRREAAERTKLYTGYEVSAVDVYITKLIRFEKEESGDEGKQEPPDGGEPQTPGDHQNDAGAESAAEGCR